MANVTGRQHGLPTLLVGQSCFQRGILSTNTGWNKVGPVRCLTRSDDLGHCQWCLRAPHQCFPTWYDTETEDRVNFGPWLSAPRCLPSPGSKPDALYALPPRSLLHPSAWPQAPAQRPSLPSCFWLGLASGGRRVGENMTGQQPVFPELFWTPWTSESPSLQPVLMAVSDSALSVFCIFFAVTDSAMFYRFCSLYSTVLTDPLTRMPWDPLQPPLNTEHRAMFTFLSCQPRNSSVQTSGTKHSGVHVPRVFAQKIVVAPSSFLDLFYSVFKICFTECVLTILWQSYTDSS